jgi:hypothetical protein
MLTPSDFVHLPFSPDLSEAGAAYACQSLAEGHERVGGSPVASLQNSASTVAAELAFRRYLTGQAVPYSVIGSTPFTHPNQYNVALGGHRCIIKNFLVTHHNQLTRIRREPGTLLRSPVAFPSDLFASEEASPDDLYVFSFLLGTTAIAKVDLEKAMTAHQPVFLIHRLPGTWARPGAWLPLDDLALKSECATALTIELGGLDSGHNFTTTTFELPPKKLVRVDKCFHSLGYVRCLSRASARVGLQSARHGVPYIIPAYAWNNLLVYGMDIILAGWLPHTEFGRKASRFNAEMYINQFDRTHTKNLLVPVVELNPLSILLKSVRDWETEKKH